MLLADEEATSEVRLGRAHEPQDDGKENPFTWLGYLVHPDCGRHVRSTSKLKLPRFVEYYLKKARRAFGRDRTHKTRYTLPRPLVVLVGVQRNLESPFVASSTYIVPYKKPLIMQETTKMPRNYYHLHTWQT